MFPQGTPSFRRRRAYASAVFSSAEEKRDAPQAGQGYQGVDHTAYRGILSSKEMSDDIVAEQPDAAPVDGADDHQDQSDSIQHAFTPSIR